VWVLFNDIRHWAHRSNLLDSLASPTFSTSLALPQVFLISHDYPEFQEKAPPTSTYPLPTCPLIQPFQVQPYISLFIPLPPPHQPPSPQTVHAIPTRLSSAGTTVPFHQTTTVQRSAPTQPITIYPCPSRRETHIFLLAVVAHQDDYLHPRPQEPNLSPG